MILIAFFGLLALLMLWKYWPRSGERQFYHLHAQWDHSCRVRGLSPKEQSQEFIFRNSWAALRRRASEQVRHSPADPNKIIAEIAAEEAEILALIDKQVAKQFIGVVNGATLHEILYPDAYSAVEAWGKANVPAGSITADNIAALTTR